MIRKDYLRDLISHSLKEGEHGESTSSQEGKCNNFNYRKNGGIPVYIMQHCIDSDEESTIQIFTNSKAAAQYVINKNGEIQEFVLPEYRAYHAGLGNLHYPSRLNLILQENKLKDDMNSWSVGIENINNGNEEFSEEQIISNIKLCQHLCDTYHTINPKLMLGHSDWSPGRKIDPGPWFFWEKLAKASEIFHELGITKNFGVYPRKKDLYLKVTPEIIYSYDKYVRKEIDIKGLVQLQESLREYGYFIPNTEIGIWGQKTQAVVLSYKLHFFGSEILANEDTRKAWNDFWRDSSNEQALHYLAQIDENDLKCLDDILAQ